MRRFACLMIGFLLMALAASCSSSGTSNVTLPAETGRAAAVNSHQLWGYFQFIANPDAGTLDVIPLRDTAMHLNALVFLEPPPLVNLTLESLQFNGDIIEADIGLRHPFLGLTEFTGFDVCGIFITNGSVTGFSDPDLRMAGAGDTRLLNPDAYSRWWNPSEFPAGNTMFNYKDGLLGTPDSIGDYNGTLNGYKYFCDDLTNPDDPLTVVTQAKRGMFSAGQKNIRHYTIEMGTSGLIFNYAVDANWKFPGGSPPWSAPDDFPPDANRSEAWRISVGEIENTLWNDGTDNGGDLRLQVDVYDWYNADMNTVRVDSPGNFPVTETPSAASGGDGYSTYYVDIIDATPAQSTIPLLISVISEEADFEGFVDGTPTTSYFTYYAAVSGATPPKYHWEYDNIATFSGYYGGVPNSQEFDDISPAICEESDHDIALSWGSNDINDIASCNSFYWVALSYDNGVTFSYIWTMDMATGGGLWRSDDTKIVPGRQADAFSTSGFGATPGGVGGMSYIAQIENDFSRASFVSTPYDPARDIEVFDDADGYIYGFFDGGGMIRYKHSTTPDIFGIDWMAYPVFVVAPNAYCSHVRSTGMDSSDVVWLAYYSSDEEQIRLAHTTDSSPHHDWDANTLVYNGGAGFSQVKNPSLYIDATGIFHICYTRLNTTSGNYELVYTKDDSAFDDPTEQVVVQYSSAINDAQLSIGDKFGHQVIVFIYENNKSIYLLTLVDGNPIGPPEQIGNNSDDIDPDAILDTDQCDLHAVWATLDGNNHDLGHRNGVLVED